MQVVHDLRGSWDDFGRHAALRVPRADPRVQFVNRRVGDLARLPWVSMWLHTPLVSGDLARKRSGCLPRECVAITAACVVLTSHFGVGGRDPSAAARSAMNVETVSSRVCKPAALAPGS